MKILEKKPISIPEARELLKEQESVTEREIYEYAKEFSYTEPELARKIVEKLTSEFGISEHTAIQIINSPPITTDELRIFLVKERKYSSEELEKMIEIIKNNVKRFQL